jgi:hypothetical protein
MVATCECIKTCGLPVGHTHCASCSDLVNFVRVQPFKSSKLARHIVGPAHFNYIYTATHAITSELGSCSRHARLHRCTGGYATSLADEVRTRRPSCLLLQALWRAGCQPAWRCSSLLASYAFPLSPLFLTFSALFGSQLSGMGGGGIFTTASIITSDMYTMRERSMTQGIAAVFNGVS